MVQSCSLYGNKGSLRFHSWLWFCFEYSLLNIKAQLPCTATFMSQAFSSSTIALFLQAKTQVPSSLPRHCPQRAWSVKCIFYTACLAEVGVMNLFCEKFQTRELSMFKQFVPVHFYHPCTTALEWGYSCSSRKCVLTSVVIIKTVICTYATT